MEDAVTGFMTLSETQAMFLLLILNQATVDNHGICICVNVFRPIGVWIVNGDLVGFVENGHSQINPVMGKILEIWCHSHVEFQKGFDIKLLRAGQGAFLKVLDETFRDGVDLVLAEYGDSVVLRSKIRFHHL